MSRFDALYNKILLEQPVQPPAHREGLKPHIEMMGGIVKRQSVTKQPEVINNIMQGITDPNFSKDLSVYGSELGDLVKKVTGYIQQQPSEHRADIIERIRQTITHPSGNK